MKNVKIKNRNNFLKHFKIATYPEDQPMDIPKNIAKNCKSDETTQEYLERLVRTMRDADHTRPVVLVTDTNLIGTQEKDGTFMVWWMTKGSCVEYCDFTSIEEMEEHIQLIGEHRVYDPYAGVF